MLKSNPPSNVAAFVGISLLCEAKQAALARLSGDRESREPVQTKTRPQISVVFVGEGSLVSWYCTPCGHARRFLNHIGGWISLPPCSPTYFQVQGLLGRRDDSTFATVAVADVPSSPL